MVDKSTSTSKVFKSTKPLLEKAKSILEKTSKGRINEATVIDEAVKFYLLKKR